MKATTRGLIASIGFVIICLGLWFYFAGNLNSEKLPDSLIALNRLEVEGAPDFELPTLDGNPIKFSQFKGKTVVLNFWATWCTPCVTEFPSMVRMANKLKGNVVLVTVAADERKQDVVDFIKTFKGEADNIVNLYDPSFQVAEKFGTKKLPETYIFGPNFKLRKKLVNALEWDQSEVLTYLLDLRIGK